MIVDGMQQAPAHYQPNRSGKRDKADGEGGRVPKGQARSQRMRAQLFSLFSEYVPDATNCADQFTGIALVNFGPQQTHKCVQRIRLNSFVKAPDRIEDRFPRYDLSR